MQKVLEKSLGQILVMQLRNANLEIRSRDFEFAGLPYKRDGDARCLTLGCKLQIFVSFRVFETDSHYICPFWYRLVLCMNKFTKNALKLTTQKSPLRVSLSLSLAHIGLP